jgi:hypothetical protein
MFAHYRPVVVLLFLFAFVVPARADGSLATEIHALAGDIKKLLDSRGENSITVGTFKSAPRMPSSTGPAFARLLRAELRKLGIDVRQRGTKLTVEGRYRLVEDKVSSLAAVELVVNFVDEDGQEVAGLKLKPRGIFGDATVAGLLGLTVQLPPDGNDRDRDRKIREAYEKPHTEVDEGKTVIRSSAGSPYAIEVLVKKAGRFVPRAASEEDGLAFVRINRDEVYAVRVINDADHEVAVTLTIDGLNAFTFSKVQNKEGTPLYSCFLVGKRSTTLTTGWHIDNEQSDEFLVTSYARSAAAEVGSSTNLGTITATFAAAWPEDSIPPAGEPAAPSYRAKSADATGRGVRHEKKWVEVQRVFGVTRDSVSVRYSK